MGGYHTRSRPRFVVGGGVRRARRPHRPALGEAARRAGLVDDISSSLCGILGR